MVLRKAIYLTYSRQCFLSTAPLARRQERRLLASIVRATSEGLNIRAGVDIAACAISFIADPADLGIASRILIDRDAVISCYKNLKDKCVCVNKYL